MDKRISRRSFNLLTANLLAGGAVLGGAKGSKDLFAFPAPAADGNGNTIFPYGTHVYREPHLPLEQLRKDFPILRRLGFNMIKIQEVWAFDEKREGQIDLSNVSQVVSDARQNGLVVYFGLTMEETPKWLWKKYPDVSMVYETGEPHNDPTPYNAPADGKPGPCWHHPGARAAGIRFVEAVGREIGKYDNILVWNLFQEIGLWPMRPGHQRTCYCPYTIREFRNWLRTRYKSLDELNEAWRVPFGGWDEIEPPRFFSTVPATIDWRYFMDDVYLADVLKWKADAFRRSDPLHHTIIAHVGEVVPGSTREWRYAEQLEIIGSSCYPAWRAADPWEANARSADEPLTEAAVVNHEQEGILMNLDHLRSCSRNGQIWTAELQGGPIVEGLRRQRVPDPGDIRRWVMTCLAAGVRGICFWNHRPEIFWSEGYGFSLLDWGADTSARAEEAGRIGRALNAHVDLFTKGVHPQPGVAIVLNEDLYHFAEGSSPEVSHHLRFTIQGMWKSLWIKGIPSGFVEATALPNDASKIKALILPFPLALSPSVIESLKTYVSNGGTVISEACPGRFDNHGIGVIGDMMPGVAELFGAQHQGVFLLREPGRGTKWTSRALAPRDHLEYRDLAGLGEFAKASLFPAYYLQSLSPTTGKPIFKYGDEVVGCVNTYGKGQTYLVGTLLGHGVLAYDDLRNVDFLAAVLKRVGVASESMGKLQRRRRVLGKQEAWFLFNTSEAPIEEAVTVAGFKSAKDLLGGELPVTGGSVRLSVKPFDIRCLVLEA